MAFDTSQVIAALLGGGALTGAGGWLIKRAERPEREQARIDGLVREYVDDLKDDLRRADATTEKLEQRVAKLEHELRKSLARNAQLEIAMQLASVQIPPAPLP